MVTAAADKKRRLCDSAERPPPTKKLRSSADNKVGTNKLEAADHGGDLSLCQPPALFSNRDCMRSLLVYVLVNNPRGASSSRFSAHALSLVIFCLPLHHLVVAVCLTKGATTLPCCED